jgi:alkylation response protein AidB-like acyl-CoA dehydrogenase
MCLARTDWDAPKHRGLTWFRVPMSAEGVTVRPIREINGGAEFCEEFLTDVIVTANDVIGDVNRGWPIANSLLAFERGIGRDAPMGPGRRTPRRLAPDLVTLARRAGTERDGHVRQLIARAHTNDYLQNELSRRTTAGLATGAMDVAAASLIKLGIGINDPVRARIGMEIAGAAGVAWPTQNDDGNTTSTAYLNGRIMSIAGGSNQIQRNIIGERLLGLPREPSFDTDKPFSQVLRAANDWSKKSSP